MNKAIIIGFLTRDPEMRTTQSQTPVASFCLAVERRFKTTSGERQVDFLNIVAWKQTAEFACKYFRKGSRMVVVGSIQTRSYDDRDGNKLTATEIIADEIYFGDTKKSDGGYEAPPAHTETLAAQTGYDDDTSLPFDL